MSVMLLHNRSSEDCGHAAICEASKGLNCKNSGRFTDPVREYVAVMYDIWRRGRDTMEGLSPVFHQDCQDVRISEQTSLQGSAPTPHISPSQGGKKDIIGRKGLTLRGDKEKKRQKTYYQRGASVAVESEYVLRHPSL